MPLLIFNCHVVSTCSQPTIHCGTVYTSDSHAAHRRRKQIESVEAMSYQTKHMAEIVLDDDYITLCVAENFQKCAPLDCKIKPFFQKWIIFWSCSHSHIYGNIPFMWEMVCL